MKSTKTVPAVAIVIVGRSGMKRILMIVPLLGLCGCGGAGVAGFDDCDWLPVPNQEAIIDLMGDIRVEGVGRTELFAILFAGLTSGQSAFDPSPQEATDCLDELLDQAYGE